MINHKNQLRMYRKQTALTLSDTAYLMGYTDKSYLSKMENGARPPSLELGLNYGILFDAKIEELFAKTKQQLTHQLLENGAILIQKLQAEPEGYRIAERIWGLNKIMDKLSEPQAYDR